MLSKVYKTLRYLPASIPAMCDHIKAPFRKRKHSDSSEMPSYADVTRGTNAPLQSGPSGDRNSGQGNRSSQQGPPVREDRRNEQSHTSFNSRKSNRGGNNRGGSQGRHDGRGGNNSKQAHHSDRGGRGGFQTSPGNYQNRNQGYRQGDSKFVHEAHHSDRGGRGEFQTSHGNYQNRNQGYRQGDSKFVYEEPGSSVDYRQESQTFHHQTSATSTPQRSRQNSESKDLSARNKVVSHSATMPHSPSDSSAKSPSSESPTTSHSLSGLGEMSTQGSNLTESSPPSDLDRRPLPATPLKSLSLSDPTTQLDSKTKEKNNSSKKSEKSGPSGAVSGAERNKRSRSKDKAQGNIGPVVKDTKKFESQKSEKLTSVWKGVPKSQLKRAPECIREYASSQAAGNESADNQSDRPENQESRGKKPEVVSSFVLLPHESRPEFGRNIRWENYFWILNSKINSYWDLEKAMMEISAHNPIPSRSYGQYNPNERPDYRTLQAYFKTLTAEQFNRFFQTTLPRMQQLALELPILFTEPLPILKQRANKEITLSQLQVACLLANAFFNTFPERPRNSKEGKLQMPEFNFINLYSLAKSERKIEKLKCIMNYFERVTQKNSEGNPGETKKQISEDTHPGRLTRSTNARRSRMCRPKVPEGNVTFKRVYSPKESWENMEKELTNLHVSTEGSIEEERGFLQADFANKFVGGGVLNTGLVQEEIRFVLCPEMIVSRLITEMLTNEEVLIMIGCERFNDYSGYSDTFKFTGNFVDQTERDGQGRMYTEVVAMDASVFRDDYYQQFNMPHVLRELNKAHCAFKQVGASNESAVCTGNWGCGAFGGDKQLKALIQLMAASAAGRDICYLTFGDTDLCLQIGHIYDILKDRDMRIKDIMKILKEYSHSNTSDYVFTFIEKTITENVRKLEKSTTCTENTFTENVRKLEKSTTCTENTITENVSRPEKSTTFTENTITENVSRPEKSTTFTENTTTGNVSSPEKSTTFTENTTTGNVSSPEKSTTSDVPKDANVQSKPPSKHANK